jgi:hypothetical protein
MIRTATLANYDKYIAALLLLKDKSKNPKMVAVSERAARIHVRQAIREGCAFEVGDYFVLADVAIPWYSDEEHLVEDLTIRFRTEYNNPVSGVAEFLINLARSRGCKYAVVGDTQRGLMVPVYEAAGFTPIGTQLFKEV